MNLNIVYNFTCVFGLMICIWFFVYLFYKKTYSYGLEKIGKELMRGIAVNSKKTFFKVYESNITPFIRYIHNGLLKIKQIKNM